MHPIFCGSYGYGSLKVLVVVKLNPAITVLRPFEANFFLRALNKAYKFCTAFCGTLIANNVISNSKNARMKHRGKF